MADKYDSKNGYNSSDFKRNSNQLKSEPDDQEQEHQDGDEGIKLNERADEYMRELLSEKIKLNNTKFPLSSKLIDQEVTRVQSTGRTPGRDSKYCDVYRDKPVKVVVKVLVPIKEHPKFNFVGKLLGPKGNTMKQLQEETMCKMAVLGRGSMRDRQKEEELRQSLDPKYAHLTDELHVEISALAPPAEAHARIAYALAEVKKYLYPDNEMMGPGGGHMQRDIMERGPRPGPPGRAPPRMSVPPPPPPMSRGMPGKNKVISILDRARSAMETSYSYDDPYAAQPEPQARGGHRQAPDEFFYDQGPDRYYEDEPYYKEPAQREFKTTSRDVGTRRPGPSGGAQHNQQRHYNRPSPYARPSK